MAKKKKKAKKKVKKKTKRKGFKQPAVVMRSRAMEAAEKRKGMKQARPSNTFAGY